MNKFIGLILALALTNMSDVVNADPTERLHHDIMTAAGLSQVAAFPGIKGKRTLFRWIRGSSPETGYYKVELPSNDGKVFPLAVVVIQRDGPLKQAADGADQSVYIVSMTKIACAQKKFEWDAGYYILNPADRHEFPVFPSGKHTLATPTEAPALVAVRQEVCLNI